MAKTRLTVLQKTYAKRIGSIAKNNSRFHDALLLLKDSKDCTVAQKSREESKVYDETWISNLEIGFAAIDRIMANPRSFIKEESEVVLTALAKRITAQSIQHLAAHTEFVRSVDAQGNVTPDKILSVSTEEDFGIYENRLVMTLIQKLAIFIEKRYNFIRDHGETRDSDVLLIHNVTTIDGVTYECDSRIKISQPSNDNGQSEKNEALLNKIVRLRERVSFYLSSPFMKKLAGAKPVHNPISVTNMLLKSPEYHKAYQLWKFIDDYTRLGVTYSIKETNETFQNDYFDQIYALILGNLLTIRSRLLDPKAIAPVNVHKKKLVPRVLLSLEDETFLDGKFAYKEFAYRRFAVSKKKSQSPLTAQEIEELKAQEAEEAKQDLLKKAELEQRAKDLREKEEEMAAIALAKKMKREEERQAKAKAKAELAIQKAEEKRQALEAQKERKRQEAEAKKERDLLAKARSEVLHQATKDKLNDKLQAKAVTQETEAIEEAAKLAVLEKQRQEEIAEKAKQVERERKLAEEEAMRLANPPKRKRKVFELYKNAPKKKDGEK